MNEQPDLDLEQFADRTIRPLSATRRRKAIMREELTAHLLATYEQELERSIDSHAAFTETLRRFGDCDELAKELGASVPTLERILFSILTRERLMWRLMIGLGILATLVGTALVLPALAKAKQLGLLSGNGDVLMMCFAMIIGVVISTIGIHLLGWGIARRLQKTA